MQGIIIDTSVWIEFFRGRLSPGSINIVQKFLEIELAYLTDIIKHEILIGSRNDSEYKKLSYLISAIHILDFNPEMKIEFNSFAFSLKKKGFINNYTDLSIAFISNYYDIPVYSFDGYFEKLSNAGVIKSF
ncbi:MAG TPA: PIN domain-containing protein [Bdellovibrionota bacterium]|nr:PIN domain-containing protein [Bdellovibrionota bacterium]